MATSSFGKNFCVAKDKVDEFIDIVTADSVKKQSNKEFRSKFLKDEDFEKYYREVAETGIKSTKPEIAEEVTDELVDSVSERVMKRNKGAYEVLADEKTDEANLVNKGIADYEEGRVSGGKKTLKELREKYSI